MDAAVLREIAAGVVGETGEAFFQELVRHLARALGTKCVWVTEWLESERRLRALSFWVADGFHGDYEYRIDGTPCEAVVDDRRLVHVPDRVVELYATDPDLAPLGAVSYLGIPLLDTDGGVLGHLAVMDDRPMPEDPQAVAVFRIFASRAAAELRRLRRDRALREREEELRRLFESAMDAILELDGALRVTRVNAAAERVFGRPAPELAGASFEDLLTAGSRGKLVYVVQDLGRRAPERRSQWIPDGLEAVRADGRTFPAEATISRFDVAGRPAYALILRDIDERVDAERRIRALLAEAESLRDELGALHGFDEIVGESPALRMLLADVERVAGEDTTVLITGETGTGKELIARAIHRRSGRAERPMVAVNCAAIAANLQESELFGHEKGAFTGAVQRRDGRFVMADGGTLFLDEVGEMPLDLQAKLLRVLQEGEVHPVGAARPRAVDVRVVAATNRDLERMAAEGAFRTDLLYRLDVFPLRVPPLRERGDDVLLLAEAFARKLAARRGREAAALTPEDRARLRRYDWPGNVRELQNVIERAWITSPDGRRLNLERALPRAAGDAAAPPDPGTDRVLTAGEMAALERANLLRALDAAGWKVSGPGGAAERLGLPPNTLASRMKALGIERPGKAAD